MTCAKILFSIVFFIAVAVALPAREAPIRFGQVDPADLALTDCAFEPGVSAMILCDYASAAFRATEKGGIAYRENRHKRIKIFTKAGLEEANVSISYFAGKTLNYESVEHVKANCYYLENGQVKTISLSRQDIYDNDLGYGYREVKFAIPGVREGCVIEYAYEFNSRDIYNLNDWYFQDDIPVRHSEYRITIPDFLIYQITVHGRDSADISDLAGTAESAVADSLDGDDKAAPEPYTSWVKTQVRALNPEPYMPAVREVSTHLEFQLQKISALFYEEDIITSYQQFNDWLLKHEEFGGFLEPGKFEKKLAKEIADTIAHPKARAQAIVRHIGEKVRWNGKFALFTDQPPSKVYSRGSGSVVEINLLTAACLRALGLQADPVLLGARGHARLHPEYPNIKKFNYTILAVDIEGQTYLADATEKDLPLGYLSTDCLNGQGWRVSREKPGFVSLQQNAIAREVLFFNVQMEGDVWKGKATFKSMDYSAAESRKQLIQEGKESYVKSLLQSISDWSPELPQMTESEDPFAITVDVPVSQPVGEEEMIIFKPVIAGTVFENPLTAEKRYWPLDFPYAVNYHYVLNMALPEGYEVVEQPQPRQVVYGDNNDLKFQYHCSIEGGRLTVVSRLQTKRLLFLPFEYDELRKFFDLIVQKNQEVLILKKR